MSDPSISFDPTTTSFGSILAGESCAYQSYHVKNGSGCKTAKNMSIYLTVSIAGKSEFIVESWPYYSTAIEEGECGGSAGAAWIQAGSVAGGDSVVVAHKIKVPSDASSSGSQPFFGKHKYQFT